MQVSLWTRLRGGEADRYSALLQQIRVELAVAWPDGRGAHAPPSVRKIWNGDGETPPTWEAILTAEIELVRRLSPEALRAKHSALLAEYLALAGPGAVPAFLNELADTGCEPEQLQIRVLELLAQTQRLRVLRKTFGDIRTTVALWATIGVVVLCSVMILYFIGATRGDRVLPPFATTTLMLTGMLGGCLSAVSRLYKVPWSAELANGVESPRQFLRSLQQYLLLAAVQGGIFAVVLYLVFLSGMISGDLFPKFQDDKGYAFFHVFFEHGPASQADFGKALIWAFIAGFSERLVPDFLVTLQPHLKQNTPA